MQVSALLLARSYCEKAQAQYGFYDVLETTLVVLL
jgi:hypothetical protein